MTKKEPVGADWIAEIAFERANISDIIKLCLKCETKEEATELRIRYKSYCITSNVADENLGYIFGYCNEEQRKKLYRLFPVVHPAFGMAFGREEE